MTDSYVDPDNQRASSAFHKSFKVQLSQVLKTEPSPRLRRTSDDRLNQASSPKTRSDGEDKTVLYLAYGSNLSSETFKGVRNIKPLSAVNVHVPSLDLTFDLAGLPYIEPCFANTRYHVDKSPSGPSRQDYHKDRWQKGLVGVVYEVTLEDYATIIATEGGGASYQDVVVPCYAIAPGLKKVDPIPKGTPFNAHTLLCPRGEGGRNRIERPDPSYAQPSARYLKLITDGGEEHGLPDDYMAYLYDIRPYHISTVRQRIGAGIFLALWAPFMLMVIGLSKTLADKKGKIPKWLADFIGLVFRVIWGSYDYIFKPAFGDGERTIGDGANDDGHNGQDDEDPWPEKRIMLSSV